MTLGPRFPQYRVNKTKYHTHKPQMSLFTFFRKEIKMEIGVTSKSRLSKQSSKMFNVCWKDLWKNGFLRSNWNGFLRSNWKSVCGPSIQNQFDFTVLPWSTVSWYLLSRGGHPFWERPDDCVHRNSSELPVFVLIFWHWRGGHSYSFGIEFSFRNCNKVVPMD